MNWYYYLQNDSETLNMTTMAATKTKKRANKKPVKKWSAKVTKTSDALDLKGNIFKSDSPEEIAKSLKKSALQSRRKKGTPYQSAMSMLNFFINRAGKNLTAKKKNELEKAKDELKEEFGRDEDGTKTKK